MSSTLNSESSSGYPVSVPPSFYSYSENSTTGTATATATNTTAEYSGYSEESEEEGVPKLRVDVNGRPKKKKDDDNPTPPSPHPPTPPPMPPPGYFDSRTEDVDPDSNSYSGVADLKPMAGGDTRRITSSIGERKRNPPGFGIQKRLEPNYRSLISASWMIRFFRSVSTSMIALFFALCFALAAFVVWFTPDAEDAYGMPLEYSLAYISASLLGWSILRALAELLYYLVRPRFYLSLVYYLFELNARDLAFILWGVAGLATLPTTVPEDPARLREVLLQIYLVTLGVFLLHSLKNAAERWYFLHLQYDMDGDELEAHINNESILSQLRQCNGDNKDQWATDVDLDEVTFSVSKTMRGLLGNALSEDVHLFTEKATREAAADRASDILINLDLDGNGYFEFKEVADALGHDDDDEGVAETAKFMAVFARTSKANLAKMQVTYDDAVHTVFEVFQNRERLYRSLHARGQLAAVLHTGVSILFWAFATLAILIYLGISFFELIVPLSSFALGLSFLFGSTAAVAFRSMILVLVQRPFSVSDRIKIMGTEYPKLIVDRITLMSIEAHSADGLCWIIPNSVLFDKPIVAYRRSRDAAVSISIEFDATPGARKLEMFKTLLTRFVQTDASFPWDPSRFLVTASKVAGGTIYVNVWAGLIDITCGDIGTFLEAKTALLIQMQIVCSKLDLPYTQPDVLVNLQKPDHRYYPIESDPVSDSDSDVVQTDIDSDEVLQYTAFEGTGKNKKRKPKKEKKGKKGKKNGKGSKTKK